MKQVTVITAKHTLNGMMYTWRINKTQLVELTMALTNHRTFVLAVETQYGSKLVEYVGIRLISAEEAKCHKRVQSVLVGYNHSKIDGFYEDEFIDKCLKGEDLDQYSSSVFPEENFLEEEFEDIEE